MDIKKVLLVKVKNKAAKAILMKNFPYAEMSTLGCQFIFHIDFSQYNERLLNKLKEKIKNVNV